VVIDNIEGLDPAIADQLFERFYRGDSSRTAAAQEAASG
jgi:signal transduction histidine kinase